MPMYCQECGAEIPEDSKFCTMCGSAIAAPEETLVEDVADGAADDAVDDFADDAMIASEEPAPAVAKEPLPTNARWGIFAAATALAVIIGVGAPLAMALTDEQSILNGSRTTLDAEQDSQAQEAASSSSQAAASSSSSSASSASSSASSSAASSSSSELIGTTEDAYILPQSSTHRYTAAELAALTDYELYLARNEVFARYGRQFKNADLTQYFNSKDWYVPRYDPATFDAMPSPLNDIERDNTNLIREIEAQHNSPYAA